MSMPPIVIGSDLSLLPKPRRKSLLRGKWVLTLLLLILAAFFVRPATGNTACLKVGSGEVSGLRFGTAAHHLSLIWDSTAKTEMVILCPSETHQSPWLAHLKLRRLVVSMNTGDNKTSRVWLFSTSGTV
jgi:hypothetical protein